MVHVARKRAFGISTHLYHNHRLTREHLLEVGSHGFDRVELFATRTHFDYHNPAAVADLQQWLAEAGLELHGVHAPVGESFSGGRWGPPLSLASPDADARARAMGETERALQIARRLPFGVLVAHLGLPRTQERARSGVPDGVGVDPRARSASPADNSRDAARRSIEALQRLAEPLGVRIAIEVIPNELSRAGPLVHFV
jgi:sugar phosphate isomerase/epimerase